MKHDLTMPPAARLCALLLTCLFVGMSAGCKEAAPENQEPERLSLTLLSKADPTEGIGGTFQYTLPEGADTLTLFVEQWNGQTMTSRRPLSLPLPEGPRGEVTLLLTLPPATGEERAILWTAQSSAGEESVSFPLSQDLGCLYSFWSQEDAQWYETWEDADPADGIVLACLGTGDLEQGLPSLTCSETMANPSRLSNFSEVQLIRAVAADA